MSHIPKDEDGQPFFYMIRSHEDGSFWSNETGWGDKADIYSHNDREHTTLPMGGFWVRFSGREDMVAHPKVKIHHDIYEVLVLDSTHVQLRRVDEANPHWGIAWHLEQFDQPYRDCVEQIIDRELRSRNGRPNHWDDVPGHPFEDWQYEVQNNDTRLGYWDWVLSRDEQNRYEYEQSFHDVDSAAADDHA